MSVSLYKRGTEMLRSLLCLLIVAGSLPSGMCVCGNSPNDPVTQPRCDSCGSSTPSACPQSGMSCCCCENDCRLPWAGPTNDPQEDSSCPCALIVAPQLYWGLPPHKTSDQFDAAAFFFSPTVSFVSTASAQRAKSFENRHAPNPIPLTILFQSFLL